MSKQSEREKFQTLRRKSVSKFEYLSMLIGQVFYLNNIELLIQH